MIISFLACQTLEPIAPLVCKLNNNNSMQTEALFDIKVETRCKDQILLDFRAENLTPEQEQTLVNAAWSLMYYDWQQSDHVSMAVFRNQPLYETVVSSFGKTVGVSNKNYTTAYNPYWNELRIHEPMTPLLGAVALVHEAHHSLLNSDHVDCPAGIKAGCDDNNHGSYSASIAMLESAPSDSQHINNVIVDLIQQYEERILE